MEREGSGVAAGSSFGLDCLPKLKDTKQAYDLQSFYQWVNSKWTLTESINIAREKNSSTQRPSSGIIVPCHDLQSTPPNSQNWRIEINVFPTFMTGKYGQTSTSDPSIRWKVESTRRDRKKGLRLVNTPTLTWVYTRTEGIQGKGKKRYVAIGSFSNHCCYC